MEVRRQESLKIGTEIVGVKTGVKVTKNKVAPPFKEASFDIMFGSGISREGELVDLGLRLNLVARSGAWFSMGETRIGQGRDNAKLYLAENPEIADKLEADIRAHSSELVPLAKKSRFPTKSPEKPVLVEAEEEEEK
jgi:recombination protein RecA